MQEIQASWIIILNFYRTFFVKAPKKTYGRWYSVVGESKGNLRPYYRLLEPLLQNGGGKFTIWDLKTETGIGNRKKLVGSAAEERRKSDIIDRALIDFQSKGIYSRNKFDICIKVYLIMKNYVAAHKLKKLYNFFLCIFFESILYNCFNP
jgi:hypothetical protein